MIKYVKRCEIPKVIGKSHRFFIFPKPRRAFSLDVGISTAAWLLGKHAFSIKPYVFNAKIKKNGPHRARSPYFELLAHSAKKYEKSTPFSA